MTEEHPTTALPRGVTDYLKGIAVIAVIVNHYAILYFFAPQTWANSLMSFFFLLSGAGIYLSLERHRAALNTARPWLAGYIVRRARRIYPLYWLAYLLFILELYAVYGYTESFEPLNLLAAGAGFPVDPRGIYWFVTAIIQCYIFAPLMPRVISRQGPVAAFGTALMLLGASLAGSVFLLEGISNETLRDMLEYKGLFLGNVVLFFMGMLIPALAVIWRGQAGRQSVRAASTLALILFIYLTDKPDLLFAGSEVYLAPFLFLAAFTFCLSLAAADPPLPLSRSAGLAGRYSYPLYLLHLPFFILLVWAGVIEEHSYASIAWTALLSIPFIGACMVLQRFLSSPGKPVSAGDADAADAGFLD